MTTGTSSNASPDGTPDLETVLFQCLEVADADREVAFAEAGRRHPALAEALQRCWQQIAGLDRLRAAPLHVTGYRLLRRLGSGGMGVVYLAEQEKLGRKVALKLIRSDLLDSAQARERFHREALAASRLEHPGLCPVFEVGESDGTPFMVMPYLEGSTLAARLAELMANEAEGARAFPASAARRDLVRVVAAVARAAHHAHAQGLVHRDIKPGNIMLHADGRAVLLDFGLARDERLAAPTLTRTGDRVGTPAYMAPEQIGAADLPIDRRTDVYALGVVLYEIATLSLPFASGDILFLREQILSGIRPKQLRGRVPHDLASVILKATDPEPARRYATASELADDLDRFARLEPVHARRLGGIARCARWIRRHPVVSALLLALAVALGIAGGALDRSLHAQRQFESLHLQGESRAAENTDSSLSLSRALAADLMDPTPRSLVQLNRALQCDRELPGWQLGGAVAWLGFSRDRQQLFVVMRSGGFHAFDLATHREVAHADGPKEARIYDRVALAPDGSFLVAGALAKKALLWRPGDPIRSLDAHTRNVWDVAVSADSKTIYTAGNDARIFRWDAESGQLDPRDQSLPWQTTTKSDDGKVWIRCVGDRVVFGGDQELVVVHADGSQLVRTPLTKRATQIVGAADVGRLFLRGLGLNGLFDLEGHSQSLPGTNLASAAGDMSPRGDCVALGQRNGSVRIYDLRRTGAGVAGIGEAPYRDVAVGDGPVLLLQFSADGERLFAGSEDLGLHVFAADGQPQLHLHGFTVGVDVVDYDAERQLLATGDGSGAVRLWDVRMRRAMPPEFQIPGTSFSGFATGGTDPVIACCGDGRLFALPLDGGEPLPFEGHRGVLGDARVERGGARLASVCWDHTAKVWDLGTRKTLWTSPPFENRDPVGIDFLPDNRLLIVLGGNQRRPSEFQIWRIGQSEPDRTWTGPEGSTRLNHGAASRDGRTLVVGGYAGVISIVPTDLQSDPIRFSEAISIPMPGKARVLHIDFAPAGDRFVAACDDNVARIYDLTGRLGASCVGHQKRAVNARFSPSGAHVVTSSADGTARIWNAATGEEEMVVVVGASSPVWDAQWSADEKVLYTVSIDGVVRGWLLDRQQLRKQCEAAAGR